MRGWRDFRLFAAGAVSLIAMLVAAGIAFAWSGLFDVSASTPHAALVGRIVHGTMIRSVEAHASEIKAPDASSAGDLRTGFCEYRKHCVMCHGAPASGRPKWVNGMSPAPPYLIDSRTRWNRNEMFWIIRNGIKMTAMPGWKDLLSDRQIWSVVGFVRTLPELPPSAYPDLAATDTCRPQNSEMPPTPARQSGSPVIAPMGPVNPG